MTDTILLAGSLSNDLFRVASLTQRGSTKAANIFLLEAKRWSVELQSRQVSPYIQKIAVDVSSEQSSEITEATAEKYLMYGVLLQNYCLCFRK